MTPSTSDSEEINQPLVPPRKAIQSLSGFWRIASQWTLLVLMVTTAALYALALCAMPTKPGQALFHELVAIASTRLFGRAGNQSACLLDWRQAALWDVLIFLYLVWSSDVWLSRSASFGKLIPLVLRCRSCGASLLIAYSPYCPSGDSLYIHLAEDKFRVRCIVLNLEVTCALFVCSQFICTS